MKMILFELGNITIQGMLLIPSGKHTKNYGTSPFIVDFPMKNGGSFPSVFCMFTRGYQHYSSDTAMGREVPVKLRTQVFTGSWLG